jgi:predicted DNA-binding protein
MKKTVAFYLDEELIEYLKRIENKKDRSISYVLNDIIEDHFKKQKEG